MPETSRGLKVLFLEDEPVIGNIVGRVLRAEGFEVEIAVNGLIAREKLEAGARYDLFIFDIRLPVMNGIEFYQYLENNYPESTSKVIFATGDNMNVQTKAFLEKVNRPVLTKPYTPAQVRSIVKQTLNLN